MKELYFALGAHAAGKEITEELLLKLVEAVSGNPPTDEDKTRVKMVVSSLQGVNIEDVLKSAAIAPVAAAAPAAGTAEAKKEVKEEKEEKKEEEAAAGLSSLFD